MCTDLDSVLHRLSELETATKLHKDAVEQIHNRFNRFLDDYNAIVSFSVLSEFGRRWVAQWSRFR